MVFALAPTATYASAFVKLGDIKGEIKMPGMRLTDKTTVHEVAVFVARQAGVNVDRISLSYRGHIFDLKTEGQHSMTRYCLDKSTPKVSSLQMDKSTPKVSSFQPTLPNQTCNFLFDTTGDKRRR
jgi:hypothetical protein